MYCQRNTVVLSKMSSHPASSAVQGRSFRSIPALSSSRMRMATVCFWFPRGKINSFNGGNCPLSAMGKGFHGEGVAQKHFRTLFPKNSCHLPLLIASRLKRGCSFCHSIIILTLFPKNSKFNFHQQHQQRQHTATKVLAPKCQLVDFA